MQDIQHPFNAGDVVQVNSGKFVGYGVVVLAVDRSNNTAQVALVIFGGTDAVPFEIELTSLTKND